MLGVRTSQPELRQAGRSLRFLCPDETDMTFVIAVPCIDVKDKSCIDVCPVDCIREYQRMLVIVPEECIDRGACEPECPVEAIYPEDALPTSAGRSSPR